jgi:hypothetical protein
MEKSNHRSSARQFGYIVAIIVNLVLFYLVNNLLNWHLPYISNFFTPAFANCLWAINLSFSVGIFINFLFLAYNPRWFRHLMQVIQSVFGLISVYVFYSIFPLNISNPTLEQLVHWALLIVMVGIGIAILVDVIVAITSFSRT